MPRPGYVYAVNVLYQMGFRASVNFLRTVGGLDYDGPEPFIDGIRWRLGALTPAETRRLEAYFRALPRGPDGQTRYRHEFTWAVLAWETAAR